MKKQIVKSLFLLGLSIPMLASCSGPDLSTGDFDIKFLNEMVPSAYLKHEYNFGSVLVREKGIVYDVKAKYYDYDAKAMVDLPVTNYTFTPINTSDIAITVNAHNKTVEKSRTTSVRVSVKGDTIDELLSTGASKFADNGISKELCLSEEFIKEGESSILAKFNGFDYYRYGATVIAPNNFRCLNEWSDKTWDNAIFTMWVYNPTNYDFEFQLRIMETPSLGSVDIDWGDPRNTPQFARPNQWTQIFFSMNKIGINRPLQQDESGEHKDEFNVKVRWLGAPEPGTPEAESGYDWHMYLDGMNVVDHSAYPDVDTEPETSLETYHDGWENLLMDTGETSGFGNSKAVFNRRVVRTAEHASKTSMVASFKNTILSSPQTGYSVIYSPEAQKEADSTYKIPDFSKGTISADFKFEGNIDVKTITFIAVGKNDDGEWNEPFTIKEIELSDLGDGWYRLFFDFAKVSSFATIRNLVRFGFKFDGVNDANKGTAKVYVDNIFFVQNGVGPAPSFKDRGTPITHGSSETMVFERKISSEEIKIVFDYKIKNDTPTSKHHLSFMLFDHNSTWDEYYGYYDLFDDIETTKYDGISVTKLDDGYNRVTISGWLLTNGTAAKPGSVSAMYVRGDYTDADVNIDIISVSQDTEHVRGDYFDPSKNYTHELANPVAVQEGNVVNIDIKRVSGDKVTIALMQDWEVYFGYFDLVAEGECSYQGLTITPLSGGYTRYSFKLSELDKTSGSNPASVSLIYLNAAYTEASGYIDISVAK